MMIKALNAYRIFQKRTASTINFADMMNHNTEIGKFRDPPVPLYYCSLKVRTPEILELEQKPWKELTIEEMRQIYFSYFEYTVRRYNYQKIADPFRDWRWVILGYILYFIFGNIVMDYFVRLWNFYVVHDAYARYFNDIRMRRIMELYWEKDMIPNMETPFRPHTPWETSLLYSNSYSDRSIFNPIKWFRDEEKALALKKMREEENQNE